MNTLNLFLRTVEKVADSIFPRKKYSKTASHTDEEKIRTLLRIIRNREHTALLSYNEPMVKNLLYAIKYENDRKSIEIAANIISEHIYEEVQEQEVVQKTHYFICTIPATKERGRSNGSDHMHALLSKVYKKIQHDNNIFYEKNLLRWKRKTQRQSRLKRRTDRMRNMQNALIARKLPPYTVCFVIDDITTTGATLAEAKRALSEAGVTAIITLALAH